MLSYERFIALMPRILCFLALWSFINTLVHTISILISYQLKPTKPSISGQHLPLSNL